MENDIKSGHEILGNFFSGIEDLKVNDKEVIVVLAKLFKEGKLSNINLSNELEALRRKITK